MTVGERIKFRRLDLGLTQEELAARIGYRSKSTINKVEMGINSLSIPKVVEYARALDTTPSFLMGWDEEQCSDKMPVSLNQRERQMVKAFRKADPVTQQNVCLLLGVSREENAKLSDSKIDA